MFSAFLNMFRVVFLALTEFADAIAIMGATSKTLATAGDEAAKALLDEQRANRALAAVEAKKKLASVKAT